MQLTKRRKNSIFTFVIRLGGVAQLVERLNGIQEVRGSTPLISTTAEKKRTRSLSGSFSFRGLCAAMPCRLRREPLRAGAAFMRVNSLTSLLRKRCLLRPPSSPPNDNYTNPILSGSFSFRGLCTAMPCRLRREPLRAGAAFMRVNSLTSLLRKRCLLRTPLISTTAEKNEPDHCRVLFCFISGTGCDCRKGKGMLNKTQDVCASAHTFFL